jgi:hypothetical protein
MALTAQRYGIILSSAVVLVLIAVAVWNENVRNYLRFVSGRIGTESTIGERLTEFNDEVSSRLQPVFERNGVSWPCREIVLVGLKEERELRVYASAETDSLWKLIITYPVLGASGSAGPKLQEGDEQVPEGVYAIESLNPNSRYHVSMRLNYPNAFDRAMAERDGRTQLGGDIMIHGGSVSIGCLAVGNEAAEDLFVLAANAQAHATKVIILPTLDLSSVLNRPTTAPTWRPTLYDSLRQEVSTLGILCR